MGDVSYFGTVFQMKEDWFVQIAVLGNESKFFNAKGNLILNLGLGILLRKCIVCVRDVDSAYWEHVCEL